MLQQVSRRRHGGRSGLLCLPGEHFFAGRRMSMAQLVAAFGTSHSPMLASTVEEWQTVFLPRDKARQFVDFDGNPCNYDTLLSRAPADAMERIAPEQLQRRHGEVKTAMA